MRLLRPLLPLLLLIGLLPAPAAAQSPVTDLYLTEVYYRPNGEDEEEEFVEITNFSRNVVLLANFKLGDEETPGQREGMMRFPVESWIEPDQTIIIAQTATGFRRAFGFNPHFEMQDSDLDVPDMRRFPLLADGAIGLANDGDEVILLDDTNKIVDAMSYGDSPHFLQPAVLPVGRGESVERVPANCDSDSAADWQPRRVPDPGFVTLEGTCSAVADPALSAAAEAFAPIGAIQGAGPTATRVNERVTLRGVVTGIMIDRNTAGAVFYTAFVQDIPGTEDGDPATSDAIPVFFATRRPPLSVGDHVIVSGQVTEFFGLSEIDDSGLEVRVTSSGNPLPEPVVINPPAADNAVVQAYYEPLEGMLVTLGDAPARVVGATFSGCGLAVVRADSGVTRVHRRALDDPIGAIIPVLNQTDVACGAFPDVKSGDSVRGLVGPLTYHFDQFKIVVQDAAALVVEPAPFPPLPDVPTAGADQFAVATYNVENLFDETDTTGLDAEPKLSAEELAVKRAKISHAIGTLLRCPTVIGIQEVETAQLLRDLAADLATPCGFTYTVTHLESVDARGIDVALLSDPRRVVVDSAELSQTCTTIDTGIDEGDLIQCPTGQDPLFSRPPLVVRAAVDDLLHTFVVNHFKSKRGGEAATERRRIEQAQHINAIVAGLLADDPLARIVVMGDFNDYERSPALRTMTEGDGRLTSALLTVPEAERYTFVFSGASQLIDGVLVSPVLADNVAAATIVHVNADYPDALSSDLSPARIAYKATDHDTPLVIFGLQSAETDPNPQATPLPTPTAAPPPGTAGSGPDVLTLAVAVAALLALDGAAWFLARRRGP